MAKPKVAEYPEKNYNAAKCPFSWEKLDGLLAYKSSLVVCADILETTDTTIKNHIQRRYGLTFSEYAELKLSRTKFKLVQKAIEMAMSGNATMLIFSLKNLAGWSDKQEHELSENVKEIINLAYKK